MTDTKEAIQSATNSFGDKASTFIQLAMQESEKYVTALQEAISQNDSESTTISAHSLKSIMKQIKADHTAAIAYEIEKAGQGGDLITCASLMPSLHNHYAIVKSHLESL